MKTKQFWSVLAPCPRGPLGQVILTGFLLISFVSFGLNGFLLWREYQQMVVVSVHDGDTFTLQNGERVRLLGLDAPELGRCGASESATLLTNLILKKHIQIREEKRDSFGRRMGLVYKGNDLINEKILHAGLARPDYTPNSQSEKLRLASRDAAGKKLGVFSPLCKKIHPTPSSPTCIIKGNIDSSSYDKLYHLPTCRHYSAIILDEDRGEQFFCSEKEAEKAGFRLAPDCLR